MLVLDLIYRMAMIQIMHMIFRVPIPRILRISEKIPYMSNFAMSLMDWKTVSERQEKISSK